MKPPGKRDPSVDWARGVAAIAMIEGHATHAWVSDPEKHSAAYAATRLLATSPLPAFMLLAGMAVRLRLKVAAQRGEDAGPVCTGIVRRGLVVVLWGYLTSAAYAAIDGHQGLRTLLRADVLHVIGLSIAVLALLCRSDGRVDLARARRRMLVLSAAATLLSPLFYRLTPVPSGALGYLAAPFMRVPGVTVFPLLPMVGWTSYGFLVADLTERARRGRDANHGAMALLALVLAVGCEFFTRGLLGPGETLDYRHAAGIPNMLGYAARGVVLIAVGALLVARLPERTRGIIGRFGRASLVAYVFHIPFCYGALGQALRGRLSLLECVVPVLLLIGASYLAIAVVDRLRETLSARDAFGRSSSSNMNAAG